jgi:putative Mg2+ transporter-C (MgtC) family protein
MNRGLVLAIAVAVVVLIIGAEFLPGLKYDPQDLSRWADLGRRLVLALALSVLVGLEREMHHKPAGMRTVTMVGLGSCLFTLAAVTFFPPDHLDAVSRVIQGIVTGIGFLGAGTIIKEQFHVEGLTTAATVWAVSAIGIAAGLGHLALAVMGTAAVLLVLIFLLKIEQKLPDRARCPIDRKDDPNSPAA